MADVIQIRERMPRQTRKSLIDPTTRTNGVIILFTGIRYERLDARQDAAPVDTTPQNNTRTH